MRGDGNSRHRPFETARLELFAVDRKKLNYRRLGTGVESVPNPMLLSRLMGRKYYRGAGKRSWRVVFGPTTYGGMMDRRACSERRLPDWSAVAGARASDLSCGRDPHAAAPAQGAARRRHRAPPPGRWPSMSARSTCILRVLRRRLMLIASGCVFAAEALLPLRPVPLLWRHDENQVAGEILDLHYDDKGRLRVRALVTHDLAKRAPGFSVGISRVREWKMIDADSRRDFHARIERATLDEDQLDRPAGESACAGDVSLAGRGGAAGCAAEHGDVKQCRSMVINESPVAQSRVASCQPAARCRVRHQFRSSKGLRCDKVKLSSEQLARLEKRVRVLETRDFAENTYD